jgi:signal transduction histidine kinase/DNA-binding response OmpR family regulator
MLESIEKKKVFIVEDSLPQVKFMQEMLNKQGYEVLGTAPSGEEALDVLAQGLEPDLILMDIFLAGELNGMETAERILQTRDVPVVYMTSADIQGKAQRIQDSSYAFLSKPLDTKNLRLQLEMVLLRHQARKQVKQYVHQLTRANEDLLQAHQNMSNLIQAVPLLLISVNSQDEVMAWNKVSEQYLGISEAEAKGKVLYDLDLSWEREIVDDVCADCRTTGKDIVLDHLDFIKSDGRKGILRLGVHPLFETGNQDDDQGVLLLGEDVSEYVSLQGQLSHALKMEALGQLSAGVAHEINTPIQYVGGNLEFLQTAVERLLKLLQTAKDKARDAQDDHAESVFGRIVLNAFETEGLDFLFQELPSALMDAREGVERVASIVASMKRFAHPEREAKSMVDLNASIENTVNVARNEWKYVAKVQTDLDPDLPLVLCSVGDFNQVVLNLLINAAHAVGDVVAGTGDKGLITVKTRSRGDMAEVSVTDTGTGISEEIQDRIFDPFFTTKEAGRGTGQGLAIVYSIIERHQAKISFTTTPGQGTTFTVLFPVSAEGGAG